QRRHGLEISIPGISALLDGHFPSDACASKGSLAEVGTHVAAAQMAPSSFINPVKTLHFISIMKIPAALCLLFGFLVTLSLGIGREREIATSVAAAAIGNPARIHV